MRMLRCRKRFDKKRMIVHSMSLPPGLSSAVFPSRFRASPMRKPSVRLAVVPLILSVALAACSGGGEPEQPPPPEVSVVTLAPQTVTLTRELPGRTNAFLVAEVRPQVNGIIEERLFTEGTVVEESEPLYRIDAADYQAAAASARAQLVRAETAL